MSTVILNDNDGKFLVKVKYYNGNLTITSPLKIVYQKTDKNLQVLNNTPDDSVEDTYENFEASMQMLDTILKMTSPTSNIYSQLFSIFEQDLEILKEEDEESDNKSHMSSKSNSSSKSSSSLKSNLSSEPQMDEID